MPLPNANRAPETVAQIVDEMFAEAASYPEGNARGRELAALATRLAVATCEAWIPVSVPVPEQLVSTTMTMHMLLLAIPRYKDPQPGWFAGGLLQEFRVHGSPNEAHPTHWRPMPPTPA